MVFIILYICIWSAWVVWVQTIGRFSHGLSLPSALAFDAVAIAAIAVFRRRIFAKENSLKGTNGFGWFAILPMASILFTVVFQIPLDWDGSDYHLPPLIESWQDGFWHHSANPYYAARVFPKTAGYAYLWWISHFGGLLGLRGALVVPLLHWFAGLYALYQLFGRNRWVFLFWMAFPIVARQSVSAYADLPALSALLAFALFAIRGRYALAGLALALHGSIKFTHIASGVGALIGLQIWWRVNSKPFLGRAQVLAALTIAAIFSVGVAVQPIENWVTEGRLFGPLQCKVLGYDFCDGSIDPNDMVVAPVIDFPREQPWLVKMARGWAPAQIIPGSDVDKGGFGWVWILPLLTALVIGIFGGGHLFWSKLYRDPRAMGVILILGMADLAVPALWYARYHLALGCILVMVAARWMQYAESTGWRRLLAFRVSVLLLILQLFWITPQRTWFLGMHGFGEWRKPLENIKSIVVRGYPRYATHSSDERSFRLFGRSSDKKGEEIVICGTKLRPVLAAYGADLSRKVRWECPETPIAPKEIIEGDTRYWLLH